MHFLHANSFLFSITINKKFKTQKRQANRTLPQASQHHTYIWNKINLLQIFFLFSSLEYNALNIEIALLV